MAGHNIDIHSTKTYYIRKFSDSAETRDHVQRIVQRQLSNHPGQLWKWETTSVSNARCYAKSLLWLHLFVCLVWLALFHWDSAPGWFGHIAIWSILAIQFTWGLTVGLIVGPDRARRSWLWWSLLTIFLPLWPISFLCLMITSFTGVFVGLTYLLAFVLILACETFCGVLLGVKLHSQDSTPSV